MACGDAPMTVSSDGMNIYVTKLSTETVTAFIPFNTGLLPGNTIVTGETTPPSVVNDLVINSAAANTSPVSIQVGCLTRTYPANSGVCVTVSVGSEGNSPYQITVKGTTDAAVELTRCLQVTVDDSGDTCPETEFGCDTVPTSVTSTTVIVTEVDGSPSVTAAVLKFPTGTVTDLGGGAASVTFPSVAGIIPTRELFTINAGDLSNGYITLSNTPTVADRVVVYHDLKGHMMNSIDWDWSAGNNRVSWSGLALASAMQAGDVLEVWSLA